jgi:glutamine amidotransferase
MAEKRPEELVALMESTINTIIRIGREEGYGEELSLLNFVVSDGKTVVASRYTNLESEAPASLYYASGSQWVGADSNSNQYFVKHSDRRGLLGIVASEPLTEENSDWIQVGGLGHRVSTKYVHSLNHLPSGAPCPYR